MELKFRALHADEVDARVQTAKANGVQLLLYKDARCDQNVLDETVGPLNWQRRHCRDNANCIISIWDEDKKQWVEKEDTGTESNTEKEKGLASDSFKRAGTNWGIGRELYTSPFIWIDAKDCKLKDTGRTDKFGKPIFACNDHFTVSRMAVNDRKVITGLTIKNGKKVVFDWGNNTPEEESHAKQLAEVEANLVMCPICQRKVQGLKGKDGIMQPKEVLKKFGMCYPCYQKKASEGK